MHDSQAVKLLLAVSSRPIMEDSHEIAIGPYSVPGERNSHIEAPNVGVNTIYGLVYTSGHRTHDILILQTTNYYDCMEDFNWLKQQESPNWRLMDIASSDILYQSIVNLDEHKAKQAIANSRVDLYQQLS